MSMGEFDLIEHYFSGLTASDPDVTCAIGDDAAILDISPGQALLVSVDTLVNGIHFFPGDTAGDIGYKSLAVNISDLAAMGAIPRWATLALTLPEVEPDWLQGFAGGFADIAGKYGVSLIGGDTTQGPLTITVQVMGTADKGHSILRNGALPGDLIYVSGCLGAAGFACKALKADANADDIPLDCLQRLRRPEPRVDLGRILCGLATAAIDISDGLSADLNHILKASAVAAEVKLDSIPLCRALDAYADRQLARHLALTAGDDYELCFTLPAKHQAVLAQRATRLAYPLRCIGNITAGAGISWSGEKGKQVEPGAGGYRHF